MSYSQNNEEEIILNYFKDQKGTLLSIGENDGVTLSNCLALIEKGWDGCLVEPSPSVFPRLITLHKDRDNIHCYPFAITDKTETVSFFESGTHFNKGDKALLSTIIQTETNRWLATTEFKEIKIECFDFKTFLHKSPFKQFDFISIDAEGYDLKILIQMDLKSLGCKAVCVEHNSDRFAYSQIKSICAKYGLRNELLYNGENVIMAI